MSPTTMIQVRNVPRELHRRLKARAAVEGLTLSDFILQDLRDLAAFPPRKQLLDYINTHPLPDPGVDFAELIRKQRGPI